MMHVQKNIKFVRRICNLTKDGSTACWVHSQQYYSALLSFPFTYLSALLFSLSLRYGL